MRSTFSGFDSPSACNLQLQRERSGFSMFLPLAPEFSAAKKSQFLERRSTTLLVSWGAKCTWRLDGHMWACSSHFGIYWGYVLRRKHAFSLSVATGVSRPNSCCHGWRHASFDRHEAGEVSIAKLPDVGTQGCSQHAVSSPRIASHFCVVMVYLCNNTYSLED